MLEIPGSIKTFDSLGSFRANPHLSTEDLSDQLISCYAMALLPSISFLLFLFVALPSLPTTEADEQIVQSLPNGGVVSISVVIGLVLTVPTFSSTACPKPTTPLCTSTTSSSTAPAQPSCSAGYTYCPGVGCCSPGSLCQGNACTFLLPFSSYSCRPGGIH